MANKSGKRSHSYFKDMFMDLAFMYTLGLQSNRGCEIGECYYAASHIRDGDPGSWMNAWLDLARRVEAIAKEAEAKGHRVSARDAYLRAFTYYRRSYAGMRPADEKFRATCDTFRACFQKFAALHDTPIDSIAIPFEGKSLPGYFMRPATNHEQRPTVIIGDNFAEELYFWVGSAGISRGYNVLLVSLPGYGMTPFDGLYFRIDMDVPVRAVVDYVCSRNDVDTSRIAFYGGGEGGGYIATRTATHEERIGGCIANPPVYDTERVLKSRLPQLLRAAPSFLTDALFKIAARRETLGSIAIEQSVWGSGESEQTKAFELWNNMKVDLGQITCPMLCLAGMQDSAEVLRQTQGVYESVSNPHKAIHIFTAEEGADAFRQANNFSLQQQVVFDWLDEVFDTGEIGG